MTLEDAKAYMISNPGVKFTCQVFHDEYIMYDERKMLLCLKMGTHPTHIGGQPHYRGITIGGL